MVVSKFFMAPMDGEVFLDEHIFQTGWFNHQLAFGSIWVFPKIRFFTPNHPMFNRVFHYKSSILEGIPPIFGNTHILLLLTSKSQDMPPWPAIISSPNAQKASLWSDA